MRSRVIPGSSPTIERRDRRMALNSVDLPTLGRPTITTDGISGTVSIVADLRCGHIPSISTTSRFTPPHSKSLHPRNTDIDVTKPGQANRLFGESAPARGILCGG